MRVLLVHPSALMYSELYLRLEPIGLERVAAACRAAGHDVRVLDLQIFTHDDYRAELSAFRPQAVGFSMNYLANAPEIIDLAKETKQLLPGTFFMVGGHSGSFVAEELLEHGAGAIDCIVRGEGEAIAPRVLEAIGDAKLGTLPGVVTAQGQGPTPTLLEDLDAFLPARDLARKRHKYFIGVLDPCASAELTRGCPWDCSFCSAWTFYGRSYRKSSPMKAAEDLASIREPNVFLVDDVAFIHPEHGFAIGEELERRKIRKQYYLETRCDVLVKNRDLFAYWKKLGLFYMFLGLEALDEEGLKLHRKRVTPNENFAALEIARELGFVVAVNIIADCDWDERRFEVVREWALTVPEVVHLTVATPYPGTEIWFTESRRLTSRDYRLFDVAHAVLPTRMPLDKFYGELVKTQDILNRKHLGWGAVARYGFPAVRALMRGQTNYVNMLWKFSQVVNENRQYADHQRPVKYEMRPPKPAVKKPNPAELFIHMPARLQKTAGGGTAAG
ncbi:MAG TPA: hopanoid C-3 methylase HpnR [Candidatus Bathyarchaeia archaeon]|nr:hopanoid C-3 methylase HpnR [Candidatus Bathyarchaeia archaeon]